MSLAIDTSSKSTDAPGVPNGAAMQLGDGVVAALEFGVAPLPADVTAKLTSNPKTGAHKGILRKM
jgi:hypothetical protein